ncbi:hypothetical protein TBK1r_43950 [Stieleria magnilauensis]|uniref:Calpain catalytic domain-containing protein n=2 Tax=Stieleria magnilauensis TaxID=2527963 RepID=A0ABX5XVH5_9BACT|nr:hypothetical protein TBK1r_43950 [Planctomycetes bacterium TBK1r]
MGVDRQQRDKTEGGDIAQEHAEVRLPNLLETGSLSMPKPITTPVATRTQDVDATSTTANGVQPRNATPSMSDSVTQYVEDKFATDIQYKAYVVYDLDDDEMQIVLLCDSNQGPEATAQDSPAEVRIGKQNYSSRVQWLGEFIQSKDSGSTKLSEPAIRQQHATTGAHPLVPESRLTDTKSAGQIETDILSDHNNDVRQRYNQIIDRNQDGFHDRSELQHALASRSVQGDDAIGVSVTLKHYDALQGLSNDELLWENSGVTEADAAALEAPENQELVKRMRADFQRMATRLRNRPDTLFGTANRASIHAFRQNRSGDCYLLGVAGSLAALRPEAFREMFQRKSDRIVGVNFPGGYRGQFDVEVPQDGELVTYAEVNKEFGFWPQVLEKAAGRYRLNSVMFGTDPHAAVDDGGSPESAFHMLTGHQTNTDLLIFSSAASIESTLAKAVAEERASVLTTHPLPMGTLNGTGLAAGHVYSLVGYDEQSRLFSIVDTNKVMELEPTRGDGFIEISAGQIKAYFHQSIVETHSDILWSVFSL